MAIVPCYPDLLAQIPEDEQIGTVTADGACDTRRGHTAITDRQATPIIPIRKNERLWKEDCPAAHGRYDTLRATRYYGRAFWKRWSGYHARNRIEARMRCLKAFGERIMARDPDRQTAEIHIRNALMNRFNASAPPRSSAWHNVRWVRRSHASSESCATMSRSHLSSDDADPIKFEIHYSLEGYTAAIKRINALCNAKVLWMLGN